MTLRTLLTTWTVEPPIMLGIAVTALLYLRGVAYSKKRGLAQHLRGWHIASFFAGLLVLVVALESGIDTHADDLLWVHMVQHELLVLVVPPLLLFGVPALPLWRAVPLAARRSALGWVLRQRWLRLIERTLGRFFGSPRVTWVLFTGIFTLWHLPALYDLALTNDAIHAFEHLLFLGTGLLFWAQVVPSRPLRPRLSYAMRAVYLIGFGLASNVLDTVLMFSTRPIYPHYASLSRSSTDMTALVDQHVAGGIMSVSSMIILFVAVCAMLGLWLAADEREAELADASHS
jgi:cytochrome c oxidase assembly factor CtaG